jgi:hypothetical protein
MNAKTTLLSLAMLKTKINHGQDYLAYLEPFLFHIINTKGRDSFGEKDIAEALLGEFGLKIPIRTIAILVKRIIKRTGRIEKRDKEYRLIGALQPDQLTESKVDAQRRISAVIRSFVGFAKDQHGIELSEDDAFDTVVKFLSEFSIDCIRSYLQGTVLPEGKTVALQEVKLVCSYVKYLYATEPDRFNDFMVVVEGQMLANALLCPDLKGSSKDYQQVTFFLDTPLLLEALGLDGEESQAAINELIDALTSLDGTVSYFSHTAREVKTVIHAAAEHLDSFDGYGSVTYEARRKNYGKADLLLLEGTFEESLAKMNIRRRETPTHTRSFQIDERKFSEVLSNNVRYANGRALENDVESVRCIYELRKGDSSESIEKCKAILVTSNTSFARAADEFGKSRDQSHEVSAVISSVSLTNLAWLKSPMAAPLLPKKEVLSYSYAALRPDNEFLKAVLATAEELEKSGRISVRDHKLLRSATQIQEIVSESTLGDIKKISSAVVFGTLEKVKSEIKHEEIERLLAEQHRARTLEDSVKEFRANEENIRLKLKQKADVFSTMVSFVLVVLILVVVSLGTAYTVSEALGTMWGKIASVIVLFIGAVCLFNGGNVRSLVDGLRSRIGNWKYRRYLQYLSLPEQETVNRKS